MTQITIEMHTVYPQLLFKQQQFKVFSLWKKVFSWVRMT